jgi:hypothetical protein
MNNNQEHWNKIYSSRELTQLGWYEEKPEQSLILFDKCNVNDNDLIIDIGAGASSFIDNILERGYVNIIASDISQSALTQLKIRLGDNAVNVKCIVDDLTKPLQLLNLVNVRLWHDRAVLHFLTEERERESYLSILNNSIQTGGYVIIAAFSLDGAPKCSGLNVRRYNKEMLQDLLGDNFTLLEHFNYIHHMPSGEPRPYIYTLFQKN